MKILKLAIPLAMLCFFTFGSVGVQAATRSGTGHVAKPNPALNPANAISGTIVEPTTGTKALSPSGSIGYCIWTLYKPYLSTSGGSDVLGYGNLNCTSASIYQIKSLCAITT